VTVATVSASGRWRGVGMGAFMVALVWVPNQPPDVVVYAQSTEEVQEIVRLCAAHRMPVVRRGRRTARRGRG
jgi:FAD/FMN-containing dehydrogenase